MTLTDVLTKVHHKCLDFRALDRIVNSDAFAEALRIDPNNVWVQFAIMNGNIEEVERWIAATLKRDIGEMSLRELRDLAARIRIPCYTSYNKMQLLVRIVQHDRVLEKAVG